MSAHDPKANITRIILTAAQLAALLKKNPQVEIEITDKAAAQVAEQLKHRVSKGVFVDAMLRAITADLKQKFGSQYQMPAEIKNAMSLVANRAIEDAARAHARKMFDAAAKKVIEGAEARVTDRVGEIIGKKFADMVQAAAKVRR